MNIENKLAEKVFNSHHTPYDKAKLLYDIGRNDKDMPVVKLAMSICRKQIQTGNMVREFHSLYEEILLYAAPYDFDSYLLYVEKNRPPRERFYYPRRSVLLPIVNSMQALVDDELDELFLSMPPRTGKTTLMLFFATWICGKEPEKTNLYCAFSDTITSTFYEGVVEIIKDTETYCWNTVFPNCYIADTNAKNNTLDINRKKRYHTMSARSISSTLNGAYDCSGFLIGDDLISGIEEALNKDRLDAVWNKVDNNLITRAKLGAKRLWIGTRWSLRDVAGRRMDLLVNDKTYAGVRFRVINIPALDENDESNFEYMFDVGFSTKYFKQRRASFERNNDLASFDSQYQQSPIERNGVLFTPETMNFYNGVLPSEEPDRVFAFADIALGGGDYTSVPFGYQYGNTIYVHDVVFSKADKRITQPLIADKIIKNNASTVKFELNNGGGLYLESVDELLEKKGYKCNLEGSYADNHKKKEIRIYDNSPEIRDMYFKDTSHRDKMYDMFMANLFSFVVEGKNKHDDAPDSLAGLAEMVIKGRYENVIITDRLF